MVLPRAEGMTMSAIVSGTAAATGRRWAHAGCLLLATMLGCAAEVADQGALDQGEPQEVGVVTQALGATLTVRSGLGDRPIVWNGSYGVWITSGADCAVTPFKVHRVKLSDGTLQTTNLGCRPAVRAAVAPNGTVHVWIGGSPGALAYHAILTVNGVGFTKRIDTTGSVHGMAATDTQIFWADDLGVRSMNSGGSSAQTLFATEDAPFVFGSEAQQINMFGIDNGLVIFGAVVDSGTWLAIGEMWTNGLFPIEQFRFGGTLPIGLSWDNDNYYYSYKNGSVSSFSRWPGEGFTDLYDAPDGYTLEPGLDDWAGNLYFLRRNTATGKTDILRRSSNGAVTIQKTDVGTFYLSGLYAGGAYLYWSNTTGTLKKASLP
jgi:hypothetical protein